MYLLIVFFNCLYIVLQIFTWLFQNDFFSKNQVYRQEIYIICNICKTVCERLNSARLQPWTVDTCQCTAHLSQLGRFEDLARYTCTRDSYVVNTIICDVISRVSPRIGPFGKNIMVIINFLFLLLQKRTTAQRTQLT